jgi:hypothetical protein
LQLALCRWFLRCRKQCYVDNELTIIQSDLLNLLGNKKPNKTTKKLLWLLAFDELVLNYIILDIFIYNKRLNSICISEKRMVPSDV